jgi:hypothetical protein
MPIPRQNMREMHHRSDKVSVFFQQERAGAA